ncbi:Hypp2931 [Branchiostoma lanceolatum]|uniref:1-alkyl-2-acetylglycerophosphocholine esterase n=1 Tax=Branchiostoma lanceolatum TaxID=7740 RepID=A0A8J9ZYH7_BRALA|nr:Hypp2931 [Branchiostoma lanceolatum]
MNRFVICLLPSLLFWWTPIVTVLPFLEARPVTVTPTSQTHEDDHTSVTPDDSYWTESVYNAITLLGVVSPAAFYKALCDKEPGAFTENVTVGDVGNGSKVAGSRYQPRLRPGRRLKDISQELDTTDLQFYSHVVVHAGTNDLTERDDEHDIANIEKEAERLCTIVKDKHPRVKLALSGICPRADRALPAAKVAPANAALRRVADERRVLHVDNEGSFQYRNGQLDESLYDRDRLHIRRRRGASRLVSNINEVVPILPTRSRKQQPRQIPGEPPCHFCGESGHVTRACRHGGPIRCKSCNQLGHKAKMCRF